MGLLNLRAIPEKCTCVHTTFGLCLALAAGRRRRVDATSHLIYASVKSGSSRGKAFPESFRHIVRIGLPACESSVARQTISQFSNVGDTVVGVLDLVFCFCGCCG